MSTNDSISPEVLPPGLRKHVGPSAPAPLRMMGAKLLVPASPQDALSLLYLLAGDEDEAVRAQAWESATTLPDKIATPGLRDKNVPKPVLGWFVGALRDREALLELLTLNPSTPDDALASVAGSCAAPIAEALSRNQLRILRSEPLLRAILENPNLPVSVRDDTADFAIRSGIFWEDVPALVEAHVRVHGPKPPAPPSETAEALLQDQRKELEEDREDDLEEEERLTLTQRIMAMSVAEKIKLATLGNREARALLLRDSNKLVALAAIESPRITESEVMALSQSRTAPEEIIRSIASNREWMKLYPVKVNLVKNPKTLMATALRLVPHLRDRELREIQRDRNVPHVVQTAARGLLMKKKR